MVLTADRRFRAGAERRGHSLSDERLEWLRVQAELQGVPGNVVPAPVAHPTAAHAIAYANHGRWLADCPDPDCNGAEMLVDFEPLFFCASCLNEATPGRLWRTVDWPADRAGIEGALDVRPEPKFRNWRPGESVADLEAENQAHGVPF